MKVKSMRPPAKGGGMNSGRAVHIRDSAPANLRGETRKRWAAYPLQIVGGGPWMLLADCPASRHNTQAVARGRYGPKCICPRGLALLNDMLDREAARKRGDLVGKPRGQYGGSRPGAGRTAPRHESNSAGKRAVDLRTQGTCRSDEGRKIADRLMDNVSQVAARHVAAHKRMCGSCPVSEACLAWALENEDPERTGNRWLGMYGGMTSLERGRAVLAS